MVNVTGNLMPYEPPCFAGEAWVVTGRGQSRPLITRSLSLVDTRLVAGE